MSSFPNHGAYLQKEKANVLNVREAPNMPLEPKALRVRVHALAINPIDHILQTHGTSLAFPWLKYPLLLGSDVAGTVVEMGRDVRDFRLGDRIVAQCVGTDKGYANIQNTEAGFQEHSVVRTCMASRIPESLSFEQACVLPLGLSTAAAGLFEKDYLRLDLPQAGKPLAKNQTVLIWGGSTSVGTCAIQLAVSSGYEVITTCSPKNFDYCRSLGATHCFDYSSSTITQSILAALQDKVCIGALAIGTDSVFLCIDILSKHKSRSGGQNAAQPVRKFVSVISGPELVSPNESMAIVRTIARFVVFGVTLVYKTWRHGIGWKFVVGTSPAANEVGPAIYNEFMPAALQSGQFRALPEAMVVGHGLEDIQKAMNLLKGGVSAKKVVVSLI